MKAIQTNTLFFDRCKSKLEMYIRTEKNLISKVWGNLWVARVGDDIRFYNGCDLVVEVSKGSYQENLETAVIRLLDGQKDPRSYCR